MTIFKSSYYDKDYRAGAALIRARRPYLIRNAATGIALFGLCIGVCTHSTPSVSPRTVLAWSNRDALVDAFTINAVGQDDFSDVQLPEKKPTDPAPAQGTK
ncbi:hypothetical protein EMPG_17879 [Blastomyces silverae]|uniref:Cytochrome c oxidase assembly factor 3 mitochondrial coiled-coil domain-containing protein n=1 Tax=Blastomyces silverae TaxID=2060906 RepID=A0A0H1B5E8_9EURO|nr:hypothetical protein EMPG_17879 [Blastomyces silverae]